MRTSNRTRSLSSILVWCTALLVMTGLAAWQFQWLPTSESTPADLSTRPGFEHHADGATGSAAGIDPNDARAIDEQAIFTQQSEPEVIAGSSEPPPFPAPSALPSPPSPFSSEQGTQNAAASDPAGYASLDGSTARRPSEPRRLTDVSGFRPIDGPPAPIRVVSGGAGDLTETTPPTEPGPPSAAGLSASGTSAPDLSAAREQIAKIDRLIEAGGTSDYIAAHKELSKLYWDHPDWRDALQSRIDKTAGSIYFAPQPHYMDPYEIQPGDQLARVAALYRVPWEFLAGLNRTDPRRIRPGQKLKVIKGPFGAVVDLERFELTVEHHGFVVKRYPVAIGKDGSTPIGEFTVKNKLVNPTYYGPDGEVIDGDNPQNPLGEYWIDLGDSYGIHGTIEPDSIGKAASRGCVRMHNDAVAEVFRFLSVGSKVIIRR